MPNEPKTRPTQASVDAFLALQPDPRRADCEAIVDLMREATGEPATMWGDAIVGFGRYNQAYANGKTMQWLLTGFSPRKNELVLYVLTGSDTQNALLAKLGKHKTGKSCLYIKQLADVDRDVLKQLIRESVDEMEKVRVR
jgi:sensor domain CHASE-containing protein